MNTKIPVSSAINPSTSDTSASPRGSRPLTVALDAQLVARFKLLSTLRGTTMSALAQAVLGAYVEEKYPEAVKQMATE